MGPVTKRMAGFAALLALFSQLSACDDPQVYGSVGVSSYGGGGYYGGYHGGPRVGGSITIGGRIR